MGLDIRWPIGLMFSLIGVLLTGFGLVKSSDSMTKIAGQDVNINLIWGIVLLVFGVLMVFFAWKGAKDNNSTPPQS